MSNQNYIERVLAGYVLDPEEELDDAIDEWHDAKPEVPLFEFLGMTRDEYKLFVEKPEALEFILMARRHGKPVLDVVEAGSAALAARGMSPEHATEVLSWLKKTGNLTA